MISDGFYDEDKIDVVCFFMGLKTQDIQNAVVKLTKLCKDRLMNVLRRLEKERIVSVVENEYIVKGSARKLATAEECAQIRSCKNDVLKHMGATDMFYININPNRRLQFYENLNAKYRERFGWDRTYTLLKVIPSNMDEIRNYGDVDVLNRYFGNTVSAQKGKPTNGEFVARLANIVKQNMKAAA